MRRFKTLLVIGLAVVLGILLWAGITAFRIWTFEGVTDRSSDAAIVLGASTWGGKPSPAFMARIRHAVDLYRSGRVEKLIFTGGYGVDEPVSNAESARDYAVGLGVNVADTLLEPCSRYTRENIAHAAQIGHDKGLRSYLIVSDPLHMRRAMCMARQYGLEAYPSATPFTVYTSLHSRLWFLRRETYFLMQYQALTRFVPTPPMQKDGTDVQ